ncbi:hypothetical protein [Stenotrophomonas sp. YIM B13575]|uniref:hypothetical protein n=1 Tax=Stenotrophomonas sp. YIM B13575 TaxID=3366314 RepID=UPI0036AC3E75
MFSMAVLAAMISIALDLVIRASAAFWTSALVDKYLLDPEGSVDMTSQALQQGGMGLILTTLRRTLARVRLLRNRAQSTQDLSP